MSVAERGWLTREYLAALRRDVRFYVETGRLELRGGFTNAVAEDRRFRDVIKAKGYSILRAPAGKSNRLAVIQTPPQTGSQVANPGDEKFNNRLAAPSD